MPKLSRIYVHGFGSPKARFRELVLDFRNNTGVATDSVLFLRNGGGKTSLISLFYSVFLPDRGEFLGRRNKKNRHFDEYVTTGKPGVILVELQYPAHGGHCRTFGLYALRRESDVEAQRTFFTFRHTEETDWPQLPVKGLRANLPPEADAILRYLRTAQKKRDIDLYETENQTKWQQKLEEVQFDPAVLRHHLKMNAEEGGVVDLFKHSDPREFARLFLEMTLEREALFSEEERTANKDLLRVQLGIFREKVKREPETRAIATFCEAVKGPLETLRELVQRRTRAQHELSRAETDSQRLMRSIIDHCEGLSSTREQAKKSRGELKEQLESAKDEVDDLKKWRRTAEYTALRLESEEAAANAETHRARELAADKHKRLMVAARLHRDMDANAAQRKELQAEIDRVEQDREPAKAELRLIGNQLYRALQVAVKDLESQQVKDRDELRGIKERVGNTRTAITDNARDRAATAANLTNRKQQLATALAAREKLRADKLLREKEEPATALVRWKTESSRTGAAAAEADRQQTEAGGKIERIQQEMAQTNATAAQRTADLNLATRDFGEFERTWNALAATAPLQAVAGSAPTGPWNPAITSGLAEGREARGVELLRNVLAGQSDKRIVDAYHEGGVFPAPHDVIQVLGQLAKIGIKNAQPLYEYLDQALPTEAEARLRASPAAHSGLLLQNDEDFKRAVRELHQAPCERPVLLVSRSFFSAPLTGLDQSLKVVLPQDRGYWDHKQASLDILEVRGRHERLETDRKRISSEIADWSAAITHLQRLTKDYSEGRVESLRNSIAACRRDLEEHKENQTRQKNELIAAKAEASRAATDAKRFNQEQHAANLVVQKITQHQDTYERHVPGWQREIAELDAAQAALVTQHEKLTTKLGPLLEKETALTQQVTERGYQSRALESEIQAILPEYYDKKATVQLDQSLDALRKIFETRVQAFEKRFNQSEAAGRIKSLHEQWQAWQVDYRKAAAGIDRADIEVAAIDDQLPTQLESAEGALIQAISDRKAAEQVANAQREKLQNTKRFADPEPGRKEPKASVEAHELANGYRDRIEQGEAKVAELGQQLNTTDLKITELDGRLPLYENLLKQLGGARETTDLVGARHSRFIGEPQADARLVEACAGETARLRKELGRIAEKLTETFNRQVHDYALEFSPGPHRPRLLDQYVAFTQADVEQRIDIRIAEIGQALQAARGELEGIEQEREIVLAQLDQRARVAERRLVDLDKASRMPDTITEWAGRSFIHVKVPASHDAVERKQRLGLLLNGWIREAGESIPDGVSLAYETLMAVLGDRSITMKILKPEYQLLPETYDIAGLHKFSGGEKVTAAILLYAVLVRYRAMRRGITLGSDSGFLLLDNPFGQVTLMQLIDLQVRIARLMGLQLIYATGVADFTALAAFPHRIMLRNSGYDPKTGDRFIDHDPNPPTDETHRIEWTVLGEKAGDASVTDTHGEE